MTGTEKAAGCLVGIGVGPGDPELITLKAVAAIRAADRIAYPALPGTPSLARSIAAPHIPEGKPELVLEVPMSRDPAPAAAAFDRSADILKKHCRAGETVAVLCEGDALTPHDFPQVAAHILSRGASGPRQRAAATPPREAAGITLFEGDGHVRQLAEIEADVIRLAIGHYRGRMTEVARRLGIGRSTLYRKLAELGIDNAA